MRNFGVATVFRAQFKHGVRLLCISLCVWSASARAENWTIFDAGDSTQTVAQAVNDHATVAGSYWGNGTYHGFVRTADGTVTTIDIKGADATIVYDINNTGWLAGYYQTSGGSIIYGFVRDKRGHVATIKDKSGKVFVNSINAAGDVCGTTNGHGLVRTADGVLTKFRAPGSQSTGASMINDSGVVVGSFTDHNSMVHGFVRTPDGAISVVDFPGGHQTKVNAIGADGTISGTYLDSNALMHGFMRDSIGAFTSFDPASSVEYMYTTGVNEKDVIVGNYEVDSVFHGFVRKPGGRVQTLDAPGAGDVSIIYDVNRKNVAVGEFYDPETFTYRAFIHTP